MSVFRSCRRIASQRRPIAVTAGLICTIASCSLSTAPLVLGGDLRALLTFYWQGDATYAGHGFLLRRPGLPNVAITAHHVAGPLPTPSFVALLRSPIDPAVAFRLGARIPVPGAQTIGPAGSQDDIAVFEAADWDSSRALELAEQLPALGDTVWVLSVHVGNDGAVAGRHPARVAVAHESAFVYEYLVSKNPNMTSGAAVLDRSGRVVGINVGTLIMTPELWQGYRDRFGPCCPSSTGGEVVGLAVGIHSIRRHLGAL